MTNTRVLVAVMLAIGRVCLFVRVFIAAATVIVVAVVATVLAEKKFAFKLGARPELWQSENTPEEGVLLLFNLTDRFRYLG